MKLTIEFNPDIIDIDGIRKQLSKWEDKGKYSADVRRLLWSIDSAMTEYMNEVKGELGVDLVSTQDQ